MPSLRVDAREGDQDPRRVVMQSLRVHAREGDQDLRRVVTQSLRVHAPHEGDQDPRRVVMQSLRVHARASRAAGMRSISSNHARRSQPRASLGLRFRCSSTRACSLVLRPRCGAKPLGGCVTHRPGVTPHPPAPHAHDQGHYRARRRRRFHPGPPRARPRTALVAGRGARALQDPCARAAWYSRRARSLRDPDNPGARSICEHARAPCDCQSPGEHPDRFSAKPRPGRARRAGEPRGSGDAGLQGRFRRTPWRTLAARAPGARPPARTSSGSLRSSA